MLKLNLISVKEAQEISKNLLGIPSQNRLLILNPMDEEKTTDSGLVLPSIAQENIPKKGVIVSLGPIDEEYDLMRENLKIGNVIIFGNYAGKEIDPDFTRGFEFSSPGKFYVLSLNEIIYIESNQ